MKLLLDDIVIDPPAELDTKLVGSAPMEHLDEPAVRLEPQIGRLRVDLLEPLLEEETEPMPRLDEEAQRFSVRASGCPPALFVWERRTADLDFLLRGLDIAPTDLADRLASARNVASHGVTHLPVEVIRPAAALLDLVVRVGILKLLGFTNPQLANAVARSSNP